MVLFHYFNFIRKKKIDKDMTINLNKKRIGGDALLILYNLMLESIKNHKSLLLLKKFTKITSLHLFYLI